MAHHIYGSGHSSGDAPSADVQQLRDALRPPWRQPFPVPSPSSASKPSERLRLFVHCSQPRVKRCARADSVLLINFHIFCTAFVASINPRLPATQSLPVAKRAYADQGREQNAKGKPLHVMGSAAAPSDAKASVWCSAENVSAPCRIAASRRPTSALPSSKDDSSSPNADKYASV